MESRHDVEKKPEWIKESSLLDYKQIAFQSGRSGHELNYSVYEFTDDISARNNIDNYSEIGVTQLNGFEAQDDRENYKVYKRYRRHGKFVYGVSTKSNDYKEKQTRNLVQDLTSQIQNISDSNRLYVNTEEMTLTRRGVPSAKDSKRTNYGVPEITRRVKDKEDYLYYESDLNSSDLLETTTNSFRLDDEGNTSFNPRTVVSSVKLYENEKNAKQAYADTVERFKANGTSTSTLKIYENATKILYNPMEGYNNIIILGNNQNINYYIITSGNSRYFEEKTNIMFLEMFSKDMRLDNSF